MCECDAQDRVGWCAYGDDFGSPIGPVEFVPTIRVNEQPDSVNQLVKYLKIAYH
jgi:hypothetical protein